MDSLKQRVLGAIVLVSLAVIFVPMLFDAPHPERIQQTVSIPPEPDVPVYQVRELKPPVLPAAPDQGQNLPPIGDKTDPWPRESDANEGGADEASVAEKPPVQTVQPEAAEMHTPAKTAEETRPPQNTTSTTGSATDKASAGATASSGQAFWKVKVGAFSKHENAIRLRDKLRAEGIKAYTEPLVTRNKGTWLRVWVGPVRTREEAEALARKIDKTYRTQSRVVKTGS